MAALGCVQVLLLWTGIIASTFYPPTTEAPRAPPQCDIKSSNIFQPKPTGLPAKIEPVFPPNCEDLSVEYTCSEPGQVSKNLSDVEPYTDYSCTGLIKNKSVFINETLPPVQISINCELNIKDKHHVTNTSIGLDWTTTSQNCGGVLQNLMELSYSCSCQRTDKSNKIYKKNVNKPDKGSCKFHGLKPFTNYICEVQPLYKNKKVSDTKTVTLKTKPGVPDHVHIYKMTFKNNVMRFDCYSSERKFKGPERIVRARIVGHKELTMTVNDSKCDFEFEGLKYLTTYKLEVVAFNGVFQSEPTMDVFNTGYHFSFYVRLIIVPFSAVMPGVATFILKRKLGQISDDENEESDPAFAEPQPAE